MRAEAAGQDGSEQAGRSVLGKRKAIYNSEAMHDLLEDLEYSKEADCMRHRR